MLKLLKPQASIFSIELFSSSLSLLEFQGVKISLELKIWSTPISSQKLYLGTIPDKL